MSEAMDLTIAKWGNSLGVRIPGSLAKATGLREGAAVRLAAKRGRIVIEPVKPNKDDLAVLLAAVTPDNLHESIETGPAVGREIW